MNIFSIFTLISLVYIYRAFRIGQWIWRKWESIKKSPMTPTERAYVNQAAFFIAVPPSVAIHELFHALAIWLFGGQVVGGGFFFFWGYVRPSGVFSSFETWVIAIAGTIGSLLVGIGYWVYFRKNRSISLSYFGVRALREQIILSLIYYPVFTVIFQLGDWRTIYDFGETPFLSGLTAVFHAILLSGYWMLERRGAFDQMAFRSAEQEAVFKRVQDDLKYSNDPALQIQEISMLREGGLRRIGSQKLQKFIKQYPKNGDAFLEQALFQINTQNTAVPPVALKSLETALSLGVATDKKRIFAHRAIGQHYFDRGDFELAIQQINLGLNLFDLSKANEVFSEQEQITLMTMLHIKSLALKELSQFHEALQNINRALQLAHLQMDETAIKNFQEARAILTSQANQTPI